MLEKNGATMMTRLDTRSLYSIDRVYVINLPSRPDRLRDIQTEIGRIRLTTDTPFVKIFSAIRPESAGAFPSIGAHGCFLSHLGVLKEANHNAERAILILEDDAAISASYTDRLDAALRDLDTMQWMIGYLGYKIAPSDQPGTAQAQTDHWSELSPTSSVQTTHAMIIHQDAFEPLIAYFERMLSRPAGHPDGGPMHVDGAYSWFRRNHPAVRTLVTPHPYIFQRPSQSDIAPASWRDRLPFMSLLRRIKSWMLSRR